jgi:O-antigen ligase
VLVLILAWTTFAFGGVYPSTVIVPGVLLLGLGVAYRPRILSRGTNARLDLWLLLSLAAAAIQTLPLPPTLTNAISPHASRVAGELAIADGNGSLPLSIHMSDSVVALLLFAAAVMVFITARQIFEAGGVRTTARGIAIVALVLTAVGIAQEATGAGLIYWTWRPTFQRTDPFGPFVNRNHFGTWAIMAAPLLVGYLIAHVRAHHQAARSLWRRRVVAALDARTALLLAAAALMIVGVVLTLSRSAILGLASAFVFAAWLWHGRVTSDPGGRVTALGMVAILIVLSGILIIVRVPSRDVAERVSGAAVALEDRMTIWRETIPVIQDFWATGTGVGTYQTAMAVYQRSDRGVIYNQAHNHYLQVVSEGGLLVAIPVAVALLIFVGDAAQSLARDGSGMFWLRAGAAAGLVGVGVQSLLETGLLTPANAVLAAIAAAILLHVPGRFGPPRLR